MSESKQGETEIDSQVSNISTTGDLELRLARSGVMETGREEGAVTRPTF